MMNGISQVGATSPSDRTPLARDAVPQVAPHVATPAVTLAPAPFELIRGRTTPILALEPPTSAGAIARPAAVQPRYPFVALEPADSQRLYRSVYAECTRGTEDAEGRLFSPEEIRELGRALFDVAPFLRCPNHPARYVARVDNLLVETMVVLDSDDWPCGVSGNAGESPRNRSFIALGDRAATPGFHKTTVHEVIHAALQSHDPRTCGNYPDHQSPLLLEWAKKMGWNDKLDAIERPLPGETPASDYGHRNAFEDMAEAFEMYFTDPVGLMAKSPTRFRFCHELVLELKRLGEVLVE